MAQTGECDPEEIYKAARHLEVRIQDFVRRVEQRKLLLDMSVSFHSHTKEVSAVIGWDVQSHPSPPPPPPSPAHPRNGDTEHDVSVRFISRLPLWDALTLFSEVVPFNLAIFILLS